jgi:hypothetical protein
MADGQNAGEGDTSGIVNANDGWITVYKPPPTEKTAHAGASAAQDPTGSRHSRFSSIE